ncbi:MAG: hypothetical protein VYD19_03605 [Myxococcota bacterium]|nr:hypothetical protein [Myxococcota bacterium]
MKTAFLIQRGAQRYQASSEALLKNWVERGHLLRDDLIAPVSNKGDPSHWCRAGEHPQLRPLFDAQSSSIFWVHDAGQTYQAESLELIECWLQEGRITRGALLATPEEREWRPLSSSSALVHLFPEIAAPKEADHEVESGDREAEISARIHAIDAQRSERSGAAAVSQSAESASAYPRLLQLGPEERAQVETWFLPFYDVVRVFMATRELRPGERLAHPCRLGEQGTSLEGLEKRPIFEAILNTLQESWRAARGRHMALSEQLQRMNGELLEESQRLCEHLSSGLKEIGVAPPDRLLIGNRSAPPMRPEERVLMGQLFDALGAIIRLKSERLGGQPTPKS